MAVTKTINGKEITFELEEYHDRVSLKATHINGVPMHSGYLLRVNADGRFSREIAVNPEFGFKLNEDGQIKKVK